MIKCMPISILLFAVSYTAMARENYSPSPDEKKQVLEVAKRWMKDVVTTKKWRVVQYAIKDLRDYKGEPLENVTYELDDSVDCFVGFTGKPHYVCYIEGILRFKIKGENEKHDIKVGVVGDGKSAEVEGSSPKNGRPASYHAFEVLELEPIVEIKDGTWKSEREAARLAERETEAEAIKANQRAREEQDRKLDAQAEKDITEFIKLSPDWKKYEKAARNREVVIGMPQALFDIVRQKWNCEVNETRLPNDSYHHQYVCYGSFSKNGKLNGKYFYTGGKVLEYKDEFLYRGKVTAIQNK